MVRLMAERHLFQARWTEDAFPCFKVVLAFGF